MDHEKRQRGEWKVERPQGTVKKRERETRHKPGTYPIWIDALHRRQTVKLTFAGRLHGGSQPSSLMCGLI
jgi:hypothetical protein